MGDVVEGMRVVLPEGRVKARVFDGARWRDDLPLVTARLAEDEEAIMRAHRGDAVLLKEQWPTAFVRLDGEWHAGVPVYRERRGEEVRVRVQTLRPHRTLAPEAPPAPSRAKDALERWLGD